MYNEVLTPRRSALTPRSAGVLLHPSSLQGRFGIGDLGPKAERFLEWAQEAGQRIWQVLPLSPAGPGDSPYGALSAFAGNPLLISPEQLAKEGLLSETALAEAPSFPTEKVDFETIRGWKEKLFRDCWSRFGRGGGRVEREAFEVFCASPEESPWLADWALFSAIKRKQRGAAWTSWPDGLARRKPSELAAAVRDLAEEIAYQKFLQFLFFRQWGRVKEKANRRGIKVLGDIPIYVAHDSADVWSRPELFTLDAGGRPELVAGVPPDYYSETGQLWGYPLYRWDRMEEEGYAWWIERFRMRFRQADIARIDHFRGFAAYWAVPASEMTALNGRWLPGPGRKVFDAIARALGDLDIVAEDLGTITPDVEALRDDLGFPGMKVLQFAFSEDDSPHLPHRHVPNCLAYTGTHDNDTARGWFEKLDEEGKRRVLDYLGSDGRTISWDLIRAAYASVAERAIVPLQDVFDLPSEARMNTPAFGAGNWGWRAVGEDFTEERAARLRRLAELTGRVRSERS